MDDPWSIPTLCRYLLSLVTEREDPEDQIIVGSSLHRRRCDGIVLVKWDEIREIL